MSVFKTYVIREYVGRRVFERRVEMALADELDASRDGAPPDLSKAVDDEQLVKMITSSEWIHRDLTERAAAGGGILTPEQAEELKKVTVKPEARVYTAPKPGSLREPALLNSNPAPDNAALGVKTVEFEGDVTGKELNFLKKNWNKLKELFT